MKAFLWAAARGVLKTLLLLGPIGGEVLVVLILVCGWLDPHTTAAVVDFQPPVLKTLAGWLSYLPWWLGGVFGTVLWWIAFIHDTMIQSLLSVATVPSWILTVASNYLPDAVTNFIRNISSFTFAWARILFGAALIYVEYRIGRVLYVLCKIVIRPLRWMWVEDKKDHLHSPHPMYNDRPVVVRSEPPLIKV